MQDSREQFQTIDNARARAREESAGIDQIDFAAARRRNGIETRKASKQLVIAPRKIKTVAAERKHDDLRTSVQHFLPIDLYRWLMLSA